MARLERATSSRRRGPKGPGGPRRLALAAAQRDGRWRAGKRGAPARRCKLPPSRSCRRQDQTFKARRIERSERHGRPPSARARGGAESRSTEGRGRPRRPRASTGEAVADDFRERRCVRNPAFEETSALLLRQPETDPPGNPSVDARMKEERAVLGRAQSQSQVESRPVRCMWSWGVALKRGPIWR